MSAWELWLWLHEAMNGIPPWAFLPLIGERARPILFNEAGEHQFDAMPLDEHMECFEISFVPFLNGTPIMDTRGAPPAAIALLERARAAWDGRVYERDADGF